MDDVALPSAPEAWCAGWLNTVRACPSPNFGPRPADVSIDLVVIHSISLPPGVYGGDAIERLFLNRLDCDEHRYYERLRGLQVSAHFVISRDGSAAQFVSCDDRAWHAGPSQWRGRDNCNDYSIGIELEGLEGDTFEAAQYEQLARLLELVAAHYPIQSIAGHEHVAPGRKLDPGPGFAWSRLRTAMREPATLLSIPKLGDS